MKFIGIIGRRQTRSRNFSDFNEEIIKTIYNYGCYPLCICADFDNSDEFIKQQPLIDMCAGFIFQGGSEIKNFDIHVIKYLYENNIPTLGICLGHQTMGCAFNGVIKNNNISHSSDEYYVHDIMINRNSKLYSILKNELITVNSRHSYCLDTTKLDVSATSDVIEAIEDKNKLFFIGVQWHPESTDDENSKKLFNYFFKIVKK